MAVAATDDTGGIEPASIVAVPAAADPAPTLPNSLTVSDASGAGGGIIVIGADEGGETSVAIGTNPDPGAIWTEYPTGAAMGSANSSALRGCLGFQRTLFWSAILMRYCWTRKAEGGWTDSLATTRSLQTLLLFSKASLSNCLPNLARNCLRISPSSLMSTRSDAQMIVAMELLRSSGQVLEVETSLIRSKSSSQVSWRIS
mmetsp:Transcript_6815/g.10007  ORF Transcript_6815/g.10007 Transcript_6815/m.10007 type:complete len:201 (-) Transcript_6815:210-812(-)